MIVSSSYVIAKNYADSSIYLSRTVNTKTSKLFIVVKLSVVLPAWEPHLRGVFDSKMTRNPFLRTNHKISYILRSGQSFWNWTQYHNVPLISSISLPLQVASVHLHCWLKALSDFCEAESLLSAAKDTLSQITKKTSQAITSFQKGLVSLKVRSMTRCKWILCLAETRFLPPRQDYVFPSPRKMTTRFQI